VGQSGQEKIATKYFTIYYPQGEEKSAQWYAAFADDVDVSVSDLLGAPPVQGIVMRIYATEAEYMQANPMAELHPGILAHAIPELKEIGVAVERLRLQPPDLARQSFRHEMTHIVAGYLSGQKLPVAFQEGLAQYDELSDQRALDVVKALQSAQGRRRLLLSWTEENDRQTFANRLDISYPESYTIMAFLADRYGMGVYSRFLASLHGGKEWPEAIQEAYGKSVQDLESEWQDWLPSFFDTGYITNYFTYYDLQPGIALYNAAQFSHAQDYFSKAEKLYTDLGKKDRAAQAADYNFKAGKAQNAQDLADRAADALASHNYSTAQQYATEASIALSDLKLDSQKRYVDSILSLSSRGVAAHEVLYRADSGIHITDFLQTEADARQAGATLAELGDQSGVDDANKVLSDLWALERVAGVLALVMGAFVVVAVVMISLLGRAKKAAPALLIGEEKPSWL